VQRTRQAPALAARFVSCTALRWVGLKILWIAACCIVVFPNSKYGTQNGIIPIKNGIPVKRSGKQLYRFHFRLPFCISRFRSVFVFYIGFEIGRDKTNTIGYTITVGSGFSHPTFIPVPSPVSTTSHLLLFLEVWMHCYLTMMF
jgi:hypothetical protein